MKWLWFLVLACSPAVAFAGSEYLLVHNGAAVVAGQSFRIRLLAVNDGDSPRRFVFPAGLDARLLSRGTSAGALLRGVDSGDRTMEVPPGGFSERSYEVMAPGEPSVMHIELVGRQANRLTVVVEPAGKAAEPAAGTTAVDANAQSRQPRDPEPTLSAFEPMYFVVGSRGGSTAKFQLSLKYRLFDPRGWVADYVPQASNLFFGYTQTSLWDLSSDSKPFHDTSYRPSLFYEWRDIWSAAGGASSLDMRLGLEHESNGKEGATSRSINIAYLRPEWRIQLQDSHYLAIAPRLLTYLDREDNPDIARYRGYADVAVRYGRVDGWQWTANVRRGSGGFGGVQLDGSYPLKRPLFSNVGGYLHLQYFNGYGESLLDYNLRRRPQFRIGFSVVR